MSRLKSLPQTYPHLELSYSSSEPILHPVVVHLPWNGVRLRFDGPDQRLRLIEILDFSIVALTYKNMDLVKRPKPSEDGKPLSESNPGPTFRHVYNRVFGPAYEGEYIPPKSGHATGTYVLSYPGLAFSFPVKHKSWSSEADFVSVLSSSGTSPATSMAVFSGSSWPEARSHLYEALPALPRNTALVGKTADSVPAEVEEIKLYGAGCIEYVRRNCPSVLVTLNQTTAQDLVADFGPPDAIYRKNDNRFSIHAGNSGTRRRPSISPGLDAHDTDRSSMQSQTDESDAEHSAGPQNEEAAGECFYNYFNHGFDALVSYPATTSPSFPGGKEAALHQSSSSMLVVTKIILHGNVPGSYAFNRHRRSRWTIVIPSRGEPVTSEMPFASVSQVLKDVWHGKYDSLEDERKMQRGMVLNRGWDESPDSSIELLGGFDETTDSSKPKGTHFGDTVSALNNTEIFGFPGMLFEVLKNDAISCLTIY